MAQVAIALAQSTCTGTAFAMGLENIATPQGPSTGITKTLGFSIGIDYHGLGQVLLIQGLGPSGYTVHVLGRCQTGPTFHI